MQVVVVVMLVMVIRAQTNPRFFFHALPKLLRLPSSLLEGDEWATTVPPFWLAFAGVSPL